MSHVTRQGAERILSPTLKVQRRVSRAWKLQRSGGGDGPRAWPKPGARRAQQSNHRGTQSIHGAQSIHGIHATAPSNHAIHQDWAGSKPATAALEDIVMRGQIVPAAHGAYSEDSQQLKRSVEAGDTDPVQHLQRSLRHPLDDGSVEGIRACLAGEYARLMASPRKERASLLRPGLARLLVQQRPAAEMPVWARLMNIDTTAVNQLVYFAVFEGLEETVHGWLKMDRPAHARLDLFFRSKLLSSLVNAHLSINAHNSADDALRTFFGVAALAAAARPRTKVKVLPEGSFARLSLSPAATRLCAALGYGNFANTSAQLYDKFLGFYTRYSASDRDERHQLNRNYNLAAMQLHNPTTPDYIPAMETLRAIAATLPAAPPRAIATPLPARLELQKQFCERASELARAQGRDHHAALIDQLATTLYGSLPVASRSRAYRADRPLLRLTSSSSSSSSSSPPPPATP